MAQAAVEILDDRLDGGIVLTKYDHVKGEIQHVECLEAGHPVPDENSFEGTQKILDMTAGLSPGGCSIVSDFRWWIGII